MSMESELSDLFELVTPTEIRTYVDNVHAAYKLFASDVSKSHSFPTAEQSAWDVLRANEQKFYQSVGFFATLSLGTMRTAEEFARLLETWRARFRAITGQPATGVSVNIPSDKSEIAVRNVALIVGGLVVLYGLSLAAPWIKAAAPFPPRERYKK